jgi:DNA-binding transcriptional LysR family regulator
MNIRQMEIFRAVMRAGSVTAAAAALNVSQPAVSAMLRHCEDQLGTRLFLRIGRRLRPTSEAEALFPGIDRLFQQIETESRIARQVLLGTRGAISIAATHSFAALAALAIPAFLAERGADLRITLHSLPNAEVVDRVVSRDVDLGLAYGPLHDREIEPERLITGQMVCVLGEDHPLAARPVVALADLGESRVISYGTHTELGRSIHAELHRLGLRTEQQIEVNSTQLALTLAAAGAGVALVDLLPNGMVPAHLVVRPLQPAIPVQGVLVFARGRPRSRLLCDFAASLLRVAASPGRAITAADRKPLTPRPTAAGRARSVQP